MAHEHLSANPSATAHVAPGHAEHVHPSAWTYIKVGIILTLITVVEVWAYYVPAFVASRAFVPSLLVMSAAKFLIVVAFYMHLKYDHKIFRALFGGPLAIAVVTIVALLILFGQIGSNLRG